MPRIVDVNAETGEVFITELPDGNGLAVELAEPEPVADETAPIE